MRELLFAFVIALILGSVINGLQQKPANPTSGNVAPGNMGENSSASALQGTDTNSPRRDFPDFAAFANIDNNNFEEMVLNSQKPVFIDCYVPNNQACEQMIPLVAAVGKNYQDSVVMARLNVMDNILLAHRYEVTSVPTFLLFSQGELKSKLSGVLPQDRLESMMSALHNGAQ